jgi:inosine-uridine nucleoside N-ribohydrolase
LKGIVIDHPPEHHGGVPDVSAIEMMNAITGLNIGHVVGERRPMSENPPIQTNLAARWILDTLAESETPAVINVCGSSRDVAIASQGYPDLFASQCRAIYLNAGTGYSATKKGDELEYNVRLDVKAFRSMFDIRCCIYWCPCFERLGVGLTRHDHGTWYTFEQRDLLGMISAPLQSFFAYMYSRDQSLDWRPWMDPDRYKPVITDQLQRRRPMWTTVGLLHAAGITGDDGYTFEPVSVTSLEDGRTHWVPAGQNTGTRIQKFRVTDHERYPQAMLERLATLLTALA